MKQCVILLIKNHLDKLIRDDGKKQSYNVNQYDKIFDVCTLTITVRQTITNEHCIYSETL